MISDQIMLYDMLSDHIILYDNNGVFNQGGGAELFRESHK